MIVMLSGGFDPAHIGHARLIRDARRHGKIVIALNSDDWLKRKKGFVFTMWDDRREMLSMFCGIGAVIPVDDSDGTICTALRAVRPAYFANGGDRVSANPLEHAVCEELGIVELFGVGGEKIRSSSDLVKARR